MKPYYQDSAVTLYCGDCREIVPQLGTFDLLLTDPPYGCSATTGWGGKYDSFSIAGDDTTELRDWIISVIDSPFILFGSPRIERPKCDAVLIWAKGEHTGMGDLAFPWKPDFEEIYIKGKSVFSGKRTTSVLRYNARTDSGRLHPTEKPTGLIVELLNKTTAHTILDPFAGSGTTGRAAKDLGRQCVMIERKEKYCEIAANRMRQEVLPMFEE
ncbi:MAG: site-specific DNA-methyltransferase [Deltaproteobacteria bacterium]|nr:site-specific DNA-methyltransferase [Deltaproteobacteria bacterium]